MQLHGGIDLPGQLLPTCVEASIVKPTIVKPTIVKPTIVEASAHRSFATG